MPYTLQELLLMREALLCDEPLIADGPCSGLLAKLDEHIRRQRSAGEYNDRPRRNEHGF